MKTARAVSVAFLIAFPAVVATCQYTDLRAVSLTAPSGPFYPGDSILVGYETFNDGPLPTGNYTVGIYASVDATIETSDTLLAEFERDPLAAGSSYTGLALGDLPWDLPAGAYYIGMRVVYLFDSTPNNNTAYDGDPIAVKELSDLDLSFLGYPVYTIYQGQSKPVTCTVRNNGPGDSPGYVVRFYISWDDFVTPADRELLAVAKGFLAGGDTETFDVSVPIPADQNPGSWYIGAIIDYDHDAFTPNDSRTGASDFTVLGAPDLDVTSLELPADPYAPEAGADVSVVVRNVGQGVCHGYTASFYASRDAVIDEGDRILGDIERGDPLDPGADDAFVHGVTLPAETGAWFLGVIVTPSYDRNDADNTEWLPFSIVHPPLRLVSAERVGGDKMRICWTSYDCDGSYRVLGAESPEGPFTPVRTGIASTPPENCVDVGAAGNGRGFFRVATEP